MAEGQERREKKGAAPRPPAPRTIDAQQLFQGDREVWIEHAGVRYRLRITRRNKLILQK
jgi:hemin uptake protein HemP